MSLSLSLHHSVSSLSTHKRYRMRQTEQELDMINLCNINYDMNDDDALLNRYGICACTCLPPFQNSATAYSLFYLADMADLGIDATSGTWRYAMLCGGLMKSRRMNNELTVVVLGGEEPDERRDALAVLRVVEVVAPAVEGAILLRVVAREGVLVPQTCVQRHCRRDDARHVDVGEAVGKVVDVDVDAVPGHL